MSRKKPIYGIFQVFRATLMRVASENHQTERKPIDEIQKNKAIKLYHRNFMLIIDLKSIFPENFIDFRDTNAYSDLF
jgi:hypothetical protein